MTKTKSIHLALLAVLLSPMVANADVITYEEPTTGAIQNCIPFGCPSDYDPHMGFVYQNISAFSLEAGDILAFDTTAPNDSALNFTLSLAATTFNGGSTADASGFTQVSTITGNFGNSTNGDYDMAFFVRHRIFVRRWRSDY